MPVRLPEVLARVEAANPTSLEQAVHEVIAACGWEVAGDGEVYNPAEGAYRPAPKRSTPCVPRQQSVHWYGGRRR